MFPVSSWPLSSFDRLKTFDIWVLPNGSVRIETLGFHSIAKVQKQQDKQARTLWDCFKKTTTVIIVTVKKLIHKWINVSYNVV